MFSEVAGALKTDWYSNFGIQPFVGGIIRCWEVKGESRVSGLVVFRFFMAEKSFL